MTHERPTRTQGAQPGRRIAFALALVVSLAMLGSPGAWAQHHEGGGARPARSQGTRPAPARRQKPSPMRPAAPNRNAGESGDRGGATGNFGARTGSPAVLRPGGMGPGGMGPGGMSPGTNGFRQPGADTGFGRRPGQEHLPQWLNQHQNLSPQQQENLLRREPGFNRLAPDQQQRVMNRLRTLDARPPEQRERFAERNEMFERLSPEQRQNVRAASQAVRQMPEDRRRMVDRAFNDLRQIPSDQRQAILNSARFDATYTPQERHVLGSLLSIEPYEGRQ
ncbi:MAG: DUF3106 domain-containing protein [Acidobacteriaceae bacterium]